MKPWFRTPLQATAAAPVVLPPGSTTENRSATMLSIIRPDVRDRWMGADIAQYTPERVAQTIRSAMCGDLESTWQLFDLMEGSSPELAHALNELKSVVETLKWPIQPGARKGQPATPEAVRRAQLCEDALWAMTPDPAANEDDFTDVLKDLADAWGKGIALVELDWHPRATPAGLVMSPRAGRWVHPRHYGYPSGSGQPDRLMLRLAPLRSENPAGAALLAAGSAEQWAEIPPDKFLIAVAKHKSGHPTGCSLLRLLGPLWCAVNFAHEWFLNFAQLFGQPIRWASYDPNMTAPELDRLKAMLDLMGSAAWAAFPQSVKLELKEAAKATADSPHLALIELWTRVVNVLILGQTLTTDVGDSGSRALGDVHADVLAGRKLALANWLARVVNAQLIPAFCRLNWGDLQDRPVMLTGGEAPKDTKAAAETLDIVLRRAPVAREFYYAAVGVPVPGPDDEVIAVTAPAAPVDPFAGPGQPGPAVAAGTAHASGTDEPLLTRVMEDVAGVQEDWLGAVRPVFADLLALAQSDGVSPAQLSATVRDLQRRMPDLFARLDTGAVADALERAMGAAVVNGAVAADRRRRTKRGGTA